MIRKGTDEDFEGIFTIINDAAIAYKGVIPPDRWHEPYMAKEELQAQIEDGVRFSCYLDNNEIIGVMGIQDKTDVEGTWKAADWAIRFYGKHGFCLVDEEEKTRLLKKYWAIPDRQVETSVVLVDEKYKNSKDF